MNIQLTKNVADFLSKPVQHFIGGRFQHSALGTTGHVLNPSDGSTLATIAMGAAAEIDEAVAAAWRAFPSWSALSPNERAAKLHRFAEHLEKHSADLALLESLDVGKAISAAEAFDVPFGIECLRYYANLSTLTQYDVPLAVKNIEARVHRAPFGVCGFVFPWNFPFTLLMWGIAPALAAGNTVVIKPSEVTPLSSMFVAKLAAETGIPDGVINMVMGDGQTAGAPLAAHPKIKRMSFTGSPEVGKKIGEGCGRNLVPCKLELGGKGAAVVFDDVDVDTTAQKLAGAITLNTGQVCCTATRWFVHEKIYDRFVDKAVSALKSVKMGPGPARDTQMGPLVSAAQRQRVLRYVENGLKEGAKALLQGGAVAPTGYDDGFYVQPSLLAGTPDNVCCREEIFGPSAFVIKFNDQTDTVSLVNQLAYGLANSVWTSDLKRAGQVAERMIAGNSWINAHNVFAYGLPYGSVNLSGFGGGVNSPETFYDYLRPQTIARPL
ncbi:MAG TPA: aldehyde dehydrogenase family protein [Verrucomicrobiae bacterium]|jgi:aldehyde dehydrogenase (NAD+)|nr:aldehyde dehydrogenase family protein [Verrucomicrobiae bacterium]